VTFKTLTGERLTLPDAARRVNLVYFWSVTCSVCREEIPALLALHTRFAGQDLRIVGIAMPYDPPNAVVNTTRALGLPFATALDLHGAQGRAFGEVTATPTTFLLDRTGRVVQHIVGRFDADDLGSRIAVELARPR
jgi:thiol-disulfide isomerase/thioredoxin